MWCKMEDIGKRKKRIQERKRWIEYELKEKEKESEERKINGGGEIMERENNTMRWNNRNTREKIGIE